MVGKNSGVCLSCRGKEYSFNQCQMKRRCPECKTGFQKRFEVEKENENKGKHFKKCSENCGFWQWVEEGESCGTAASASRPVAVEAVPEMAQLFQSALQLKDDEEVRISIHVNMTITKKKSMDEGSAGVVSMDEGNGKGKGRLE